MDRLTLIGSLYDGFGKAGASAMIDFCARAIRGRDEMSVVMQAALMHDQMKWITKFRVVEVGSEPTVEEVINMSPVICIRPQSHKLSTDSIQNTMSISKLKLLKEVREGSAGSATKRVIQNCKNKTSKSKKQCEIPSKTPGEDRSSKAKK